MWLFRDQFALKPAWTTPSDSVCRCTRPSVMSSLPTHSLTRWGRIKTHFPTVRQSLTINGYLGSSVSPDLLMPLDRLNASLQELGDLHCIRGWRLIQLQQLGDLPAVPLSGEQPGRHQVANDGHLQKLHIQYLSHVAPGSQRFVSPRLSFTTVG